ncbi:hypothetical protein [uncultured Zhongshania sp.]|uniref:hypothetical protein n=1 Tax=uncultured Zhongshania sp. TaxID=1642288 RepID=UPI0025F04940|nr:hypothetical protein [uncultured Zhongshania sp.]
MNKMFALENKNIRAKRAKYLPLTICGSSLLWLTCSQLLFAQENTKQRLSALDCLENEATPRVPGRAEKCSRKDERKPRIPIPKLDDFSPATAIPDRWRIVEALGYENNWYDPYHRNTLKADTPIHDDWFFNLSIIADTVFEYRDVQTPVGIQTTANAGDLDLYGGTKQSQFIENLAVELVYYKGDTVFRPPDYEFRFTPVFNYNATKLEEVLGIDVNPAEGKTRYQDFAGLQAAFVDVHLRNVSDNYDFDSVRLGIQPFNADFRGFLFQENQFGLRLFGTRENNIIQYNLAWFRRLEKDTNSGLNNIGETPRDDDIFVANLYWQDLLALGHTSQFTVLYNRNREKDFFFDKNGVIQRPASIGSERPRHYDVVYFGLNSDGHLGRLNITTALYYAIGKQEDAPFSNDDADISAYFAAAELSFDQDWIRWRASFLFASGDEDPYDDKETGFDAVVENPLFAGADTSYWIRQAVPLIGGGKVALSSRNGVLNSLRASKEHGQSNFTNPGTVLFGIGADFDVLPELRISFNANQLWFDDTSSLEVARQQANIANNIGQDLSVATIYRPFMSQNIVLRLSYAVLLPGEGYQQLYSDHSQQSVLFNAIFTY